MLSTFIFDVLDAPLAVHLHTQHAAPLVTQEKDEPPVSFSGRGKAKLSHEFYLAGNVKVRGDFGM